MHLLPRALLLAAYAIFLGGASVAAGPSPAEAEFALYGVVYGAGVPREGTRIRAFPTVDVPADRPWAALPETVTDENRRFRLPIPWGGKWIVEATRTTSTGVFRRAVGLFEAHTAPPSSGPSLLLSELPLRGTVRILVEGPDGSPVPSARVRHVRASSDADLEHTFALDGEACLALPVEEGDRLYVSEARSLRGVPLPHAGTWTRLGADRRTVVVRLLPGTTIEGVVVQKDGEPAANARVFASASDDAHAPDVDGTADARGSFVLGPVSDALYTLGVRPGGPWAGAEPVVVKGGTTGCRVVARALIDPRVTVLLPDGSPAAEAGVQWSREGRPGEPVSYSSRDMTRTDATGVAVLHAVAPEAPLYLFIGTSTGVRALARRAELRAWKPTDVIVRLHRARLFRVRVVDGDGAPVPPFPESHVTVTDEDGGCLREAGADPRGSTWRVRADGAVRVWAHGNGDFPVDLADPEAVVASDVQEHVVRLDMPAAMRLSIPGWVARPHPVRASLRGRSARWEVRRFAPVADDGSIVFERLPQDLVADVHVPPADGLPGAHGASLSPREELQALEAHEGPPLRVHVEWPDGATGGRLTVAWSGDPHSGKDGTAEEVSPGVYEVRHLPMARYRIRASIRAFRREYLAEALALPGEEVRLRPEPRPAR